jgi:hypothetical protein
MVSQLSQGDQPDPPGQCHQPKPFGIDFLDPLFAIAIHIGFAEGILKELPAGKERTTFDYWVFSLGFITLMLSWIGYHQSIKKRPLVEYSSFNFLNVRFWFDVLCVMLYAAMMIYYLSLAKVVWFIVLVFACYVIWDIAKILEKVGIRVWGVRENVSLVFLLLSLLLAWIQEIVASRGQLEFYAVAILAAAYGLVIGYRFAKEFFGRRSTSGFETGEQ